MSYREYLRLEHAEVAGALVLLPGSRHDLHAIYDCDSCSDEIPEQGRWFGMVELQPPRSATARVQLDLCARCVAAFPPGILAMMARGYGLKLPGAGGEAMTPS
jgi:hypothetical protein